jgi:PAS domain S-box-containing protein
VERSNAEMARLAEGVTSHGDRAERLAARAVESARKADELAGRAEAHATRLDALAEQLERAADRAEQAAAGAERGAADAREAREGAEVEARVAKVQSEAARTHVHEAGRFARESRESAKSAREDGAGSSGSLRSPGARITRFDGPLRRKRLAAPARKPRPGFDDAQRPMATIGTDGSFRELNTRFSELVGYSESEFQAASWPPAIDRENMPRHREQLRAMRAGELDSVEVSTAYVHAQGLQVPVAGLLSAVRGRDGKPEHYLLEVRTPRPT